MQGIFQKENTDKALKYGIYRHLPTYEKIIRNLVSFLQKTADLKFVVDKIESAVYNAFYRQRSTVGTSVFEGKQIFKNPGVKKTGYRIFLFVLYSSRQNSNYDGKTI